MFLFFCFGLALLALPQRSSSSGQAWWLCWAIVLAGLAGPCSHRWLSQDEFILVLPGRDLNGSDLALALSNSGIPKFGRALELTGPAGS